MNQEERKHICLKLKHTYGGTVVINQEERIKELEAENNRLVKRVKQYNDICNGNGAEEMMCILTHSAKCLNDGHENEITYLRDKLEELETKNKALALEVVKWKELAIRADERNGDN